MIKQNENKGRAGRVSRVAFATVVLSVLIHPVLAQKTARIVARFVEFGSSSSFPIPGTVRIRRGDYLLLKRTTPKGWLVANVPCGRYVTFEYGQAFEFSHDALIPCRRKAVPIGLFDWRRGSLIGADMDTVDGWRFC